MQADNFELKLVMFQLLETVGQFIGMPLEDPHLHHKLSLEIIDVFKIAWSIIESIKTQTFPK